jgi:hypothetical protein
VTQKNIQRLFKNLNEVLIPFHARVIADWKLKFA